MNPRELLKQHTSQGSNISHFQRLPHIRPSNAAESSAASLISSALPICIELWWCCWSSKLNILGGWNNATTFLWPKALGYQLSQAKSVAIATNQPRKPCPCWWKSHDGKRWVWSRELHVEYWLVKRLSYKGYDTSISHKLYGHSILYPQQSYCLPLVINPPNQSLAVPHFEIIRHN